MSFDEGRCNGDEEIECDFAGEQWIQFFRQAMKLLGGRSVRLLFGQLCDFLGIALRAGRELGARQGVSTVLIDSADLLGEVSDFILGRKFGHAGSSTLVRVPQLLCGLREWESVARTNPHGSPRH
ncbi:hypothetical protein [Rhodococcus sp. 3-2]|uniref:hypothetical protein n=1 Tax=Rhodococcus sp. 3-2 TaxID=2890836 RepID=UPI001D17D7DD|nr:hypothetical protein [Rhodococcus sp. 3-2]MCC4300443.1 hypothetical protein [Rhodococcus sp. 3-2]